MSYRFSILPRYQRSQLPRDGAIPETGKTSFSYSVKSPGTNRGSVVSHLTPSKTISTGTWRFCRRLPGLPAWSGHPASSTTQYRRRWRPGAFPLLQRRKPLILRLLWRGGHARARMSATSRHAEDSCTQKLSRTGMDHISTTNAIFATLHWRNGSANCADRDISRNLSSRTLIYSHSGTNSHTDVSHVTERT